MRILADVNISPKVVACLRDLGIDAERVSNVLDARASDEEVLAEAARQNAVLVSRDQDFSAILAATNATKPSHVNVRVSQVEADRLATLLASVLKATAADLSAGAIVTVTDAGTRVHRLPVR
jgi:predicted nuclease of predicted toxin-antitoxin system